MTKILLTDGWTRKSLSAVRSLGVAGYSADVIAHKRISPAFYSRCTGKSLVCPDPVQDREGYLSMLLRLIERERYDVVMPFEEATIELMLENRDRFNALTAFALPETEAYRVASNKWETVKLAKSLGIPVPATELVADESGIEAALEGREFPLIIKPVRGGGSVGLAEAYDRSGGEQAVRHALRRFGPLLVQERLPWQGRGEGVGILADRGKVKVAFTYRRLREFPVKGGPSTLRESTSDSELAHHAITLMEALDWHGVAMVEFKTDLRDGARKLMEINPRFWGSMDLAFVSGVNFPALLTDLSLGREVRQPGYRDGVRCRWLVPGDLAHFIANPARLNLDPSFFDFRGERLFYDDFKSHDMRGNLAVIACAFLSIFDLDTWRKGVFRN